MKKLFLLLTFITLTSTSFASSNYDANVANEESKIALTSFEIIDVFGACYGNFTQEYTRADGSTGTRTMTLYLGETRTRSECIIRAYAQLARLNEQ